MEVAGSNPAPPTIFMFMVFVKGELPYFTFTNLSQFSFLKHAIVTREGGYSHGPYASLDLSYTVGDLAENVNKNLEKVKSFFKAKKLVWTHQAHGKRVLVITNKKLTSYIGFDALITNQPNIALLVKLADCQGILLCDPKKKVIAAIHCGWRGSVANVIGETIKVMQKEFKSDPKDIWAGVSPSFGPCCAEFRDYKTLLPSAFWQYKIKNNHFDWWAISCRQLQETGIPKHQIELAQICTVCDKRFFSYRRDGKRTGRFGAVITLKGEEGDSGDS